MFFFKQIIENIQGKNGDEEEELAELTEEFQKLFNETNKNFSNMKKAKNLLEYASQGKLKKFSKMIKDNEIQEINQIHYQEMMGHDNINSSRALIYSTDDLEQMQRISYLFFQDWTNNCKSIYHKLSLNKGRKTPRAAGPLS